MKKKRVTILSPGIFILILCLILGCRASGSAGNANPAPAVSPQENASSTIAASGGFALTSPSYKEGGNIPRKNGHKGARGQNLSIPLSWTNPPGGTRSFLIVMDDPDADGFLHWSIFNIPANVLSLVENASAAKAPQGSIQIENDFGEPGYGGPHPPEKHRYVITIYALSSLLEGVDEKSPVEQVMKVAKGRILGKASLSGFFTP